MEKNAIDYSIKKNPSMLFVVGFLLVILVGATLLNFPFSSVDGRSIGFIDALFTSTSAVCVTGLSTVVTADYWTIGGKVIILILIQIGGLGLMTLSTLITLFLGKRISLKTRMLIKEERNSDDLQGVVKVTKNVLIYTFIVELIGALLYMTAFCRDFGIHRGIWYSIFHSISAFCNAGFDLIGGQSLTPYVTNPIINITTCALIICGGLGFIVVIELLKIRKFSKFSLHTKVVVVMTISLLLIGTILFFSLEYTNDNTIGNLNFFEKLQASFFQSVTTRTAGFFTVELSQIRNATAIVMMVLMFIGGSSGSTAGGVKVTTIAVVILALYTNASNKNDINIWKKRISMASIMKAFTIVGIGFIVIFIVFTLVNVFEVNKNMSFVDLMFETVSAFGTVGLSRNVTSNLSVASKLVISFTMFVGRVGPLTIATAFAVGKNKNVGNYSYPEAKIIIG